MTVTSFRTVWTRRSLGTIRTIAVMMLVPFGRVGSLTRTTTHGLQLLFAQNFFELRIHFGLQLCNRFALFVVQAHVFLDERWQYLPHLWRTAGTATTLHVTIT